MYNQNDSCHGGCSWILIIIAVIILLGCFCGNGGHDCDDHRHCC